MSQTPRDAGVGGVAPARDSHAPIKIVGEYIIDNSKSSPLWETVAKANMSVTVDMDPKEWEGYTDAEEAISIAGIEDEMRKIAKEWLAIWLAQEEAPSTLVLIALSGGHIITITNER